MDVVLEQWHATVINREKEQQVRNGRPLVLDGPGSTDETLCRAYSIDGCFLAVLRFSTESGLWQPEKVFSTAYRDLKVAPQH